MKPRVMLLAGTTAAASAPAFRPMVKAALTASHLVHTGGLR